MDHQVEATGASVDEALEKALAALGAKRADVRFEVLESGSTGFLGLFKGRQVRVRVERLVHAHDDVGDLVHDLLQSMGIAAQLDSKRHDDVTQIHIRTDGMDGLLIGRRGQTLAALQHVIGRLASREFGPDGHIVVDVGEYRLRREAHLVDKATALAEKVRTTGREISLEPLHAPDRRVVHLAVAKIDGVRSYTVGHGLHRNVVIAPDSRERDSTDER
jgi:spoIIIJ-associated protein